MRPGVMLTKMINQYSWWPKMYFYITKMSGEKEIFKPEKLIRSLQKAGAPADVIQEILKEVEKNPTLRSTREIYAFAYEYLRQTKPSLGARYSLKKALLDFGPAGFPFEQYVAHLFRMDGYAVQTNLILKGYCVDHEIDLICSTKEQKYMVECKFHGKQELKSDIKVSLYIKARLDDLNERGEKKKNLEFEQAWIVTNTKFTSEAIKFALCRNIKLLGWDYPAGNALPDIVDRYGLHPVTALTTLSGSQKRMLLENNITLCKEVVEDKNKLRSLGFSAKEMDAMLQESSEVCKL